MLTAIINARIFDGHHVLEERSVLLEGATVRAVGETSAAADQVVDARGGTLIPGLIDAHVHTSNDGLRNALVFGVTTELEMMGFRTAEERREVAECDEMADVRSAGFGLTAPGGHPSELHRRGDAAPKAAPKPDCTCAVRPGRGRFTAPTASTPEEAIAFIATRVADGSDFIKIMIEEGGVLAAPGLPMLSHPTVVAAVREAHRHGKLAIAHALTLDAAQQAIAAGIDGLAHIFIDQPHTPDIVAAIAAAGIFVTPCLVLNASIMGGTGKALAADPRVAPYLSQDWLETLRSSFNTYPQGRFDDVLATVGALHAAGVDILAGTDVSMPVPHLGGLAHGASVHQELQLLVQAGLSAVEALRAATSVPARRFGLSDRGRIQPGYRADLILIDGDPTTAIGASLSIRAIWRRGARLARRDSVTVPAAA